MMYTNSEKMFLISTEFNLKIFLKPNFRVSWTILYSICIVYRDVKPQSKQNKKVYVYFACFDCL